MFKIIKRILNKKNIKKTDTPENTDENVDVHFGTGVMEAIDPETGEHHMIVSVNGEIEHAKKLYEILKRNPRDCIFAPLEMDPDYWAGREDPRFRSVVLKDGTIFPGDSTTCAFSRLYQFVIKKGWIPEAMSLDGCGDPHSDDYCLSCQINMDSLLGVSIKDSPISQSVSKIINRVEYIFKMSERALLKNKTILNKYLEMMKDEILRVEKLADGYPHKTPEISDEVWYDGINLADYSMFLAEYLSDKDFLEEQSYATNLWVMATLSVCRHYYHLVGPAMIANAEISERTDAMEYAKTAYNAVLKDFECILEGAEEDEFKPIEETIISLESLNKAATRLVELEDTFGTNPKALEIKKRLEVVFSKPDEPENSN